MSNETQSLPGEMTRMIRHADRQWRMSASKDFDLSAGRELVESGPLVRSSYHADEQSQKYTGVDHLNTHNALASA